MIEPHEAANQFPLMDDKRFGELPDSIRENGLQTPIVLFDGQILDGRNRYKACTEEGVKPRFTEYDGNPWAYAWDANGQRREACFSSTGPRARCFWLTGGRAIPSDSSSTL